jgi:exodeoxyribonuclease III
MKCDLVPVDVEKNCAVLTTLLVDVDCDYENDTVCNVDDDFCCNDELHILFDLECCGVMQNLYVNENECKKIDANVCDFDFCCDENETDFIQILYNIECDRNVLDCIDMDLVDSDCVCTTDVDSNWCDDNVDYLDYHNDAVVHMNDSHQCLECTDSVDDAYVTSDVDFHVIPPPCHPHHADPGDEFDCACLRLGDRGECSSGSRPSTSTSSSVQLLQTQCDDGDDSPTSDPPLATTITNPIITTAEFNQEYSSLTSHSSAIHAITPSPPLVPTSFETWNIDGIEPRLKKNLPDLSKYTKQVNDRRPSIISIQEVRLRCHPSCGHGVIHSGDAHLLKAFLDLFPDYKCIALTLATMKYAGQLLLLRNGCQVPHVKYVFTVESESHDAEGRIILAEFRDILVLSTYTPCTSHLERDKLLRRRAFDNKVTIFLENHANVSPKPLVYCGDLNVAANSSDMSHDLEHWSTAALSKQYNICDDPLDYSFPGTAANLRTRFAIMLRKGQLCDPGDYPELHGRSHFTWTGHPESIYRDHKLRLDYILISNSLADHHCVARYSTTGHSVNRQNYFGSDHCPVFLELKSNWKARLQLANGTPILLRPHTPLPIVKARERQKASKKINAKAKQDREKIPMLQFLLMTMLLSSLVTTTTTDMPAADQYMATHSTANVIIDSSSMLSAETLFDTGCSNANYMSGDFYDKNKNVLEPLTQQCDTRVYFGDKTAFKSITRKVTVNLRFELPDSTHEAPCHFYVLDGKGTDLIIGTPSIFTDFCPVFLTLIGDAVHKLKQPMVAHESLASMSYKHETPPSGTEYPWQTDVNMDAPEDDNIPEASSYRSEVLNFLNQSVEAETQKFKEFIETNIDQDLLAHPETRLLLNKYMDCFVKEEWKGLNIAPVEFEFDADMPDRLKPRHQPIPHQLQADTRKEFDRLCKYFFKPCHSPWASPLTVAPKATDPFIRLCINLQRINQYIKFGHPPIPDVKETLDQLQGFEFFCDIDAKNGYHQVPLADSTARKLSVQTPWGQFQPQFLPEGVCCGTAVFQQTMMDIFDKLNIPGEEKWMFVLHDNFLIGAHSHEQSLERLAIFFECAREANVYLKMEKTHIGQRKQHFFGYDIEKDKYAMSPSRAEVLQSVPFPSGKPASCGTAMRSFLGQTRIFAPHVPDYTLYSGPLDEMTSKNFDWSESTWTKDYKNIFEEFKIKLVSTMALFYPDYQKDWILRTDASGYGYGGVLYQVNVDVDGKKLYQPLKFMSRKFSDPATRWDTLTQECYGIFACIKECEYLLRGKPFVIETDHNNLLWLEQSQVPKIIRQHLYIRSFTTWIRHVPGKINTADYWSRLVRDTNDPVLMQLLSSSIAAHDDEAADDYVLANILPALDKFKKAHGVPNLSNDDGSPKSATELLKTVHGGNFLHQGARRTWLLLNDIYPGHKVPLRTVAEFVESCSVCQKHRHGLRDTLKPFTRVLKPESHRHTLGIDTVSITPKSDDDFTAIITMVNHHTHFVYLYPVKSHNAKEMCSAIMSYIGNFGLVDEIISDPGSELMSQAVSDLNKWIGLRHTVSLVDVHTSNGCENTNRQVVQHLSAMVSDLRLKHSWSDPMFISLLQFHFNSSLSREAGIAPFHAMMGSADEVYYKLDPDVSPAKLQTAYVKLLDKNLKLVRTISKEYQAKLAKKRTEANVRMNQFVVGDYVLKTVRTPTKPWKPEKVGVGFTGPWKVLSVNQNDYKCEHLNHKEVATFHVDMLKPFWGTEEDAQRTAMLDKDQYGVTKVSHYTGDPRMRDTCDFYFHYEDGDERWQAWRPELKTCQPFISYCESRPELWEFLMNKTEAIAIATALNKQPITMLTVTDKLFVDLRALGQAWYDVQDLPAEDYNTYVVECYVREFLNARHTRLRVMFPLLEVYMDWNHTMVRMWGQYHKPHPHHTLFDRQLLSRCPKVWASLGSSRKAYHQLLKEHPLKPPVKLPSNRSKPSNSPAAPRPQNTKTSKPPAAPARRSARFLQGGKG